MLSDRDYMRAQYRGQRTSAVTWLLCIVGVAFVFQLAYERILHSPLLVQTFALTAPALAEGHLWTLATYALLHTDVLQLLLNGICLFLLGRELVPLVGNRRFFGLCFAAAVTGGLAWSGVHGWGHTASLMGAFSIVASLFIVWACAYPEREIPFLLFFVLPVTLKPKVLAWVLVSLEVLALLFGEIPDTFDLSLAPSAHLGGMLVGWIFYRYFLANNGWDRAPSPVLELPSWLKRSQKSRRVPPAYKVNIQEHPDLRTEVDRILDKINSEGFAALTEEEKHILDEAKELLSRRH
jgi:membrane associated rhomboid family serine protease